jgi:Flp pilus assembly protein TadD
VAPVQPSSPSGAAPTAALTQPSAASPAAAEGDPTDTRKLLLAARNRVSNGDALGAAAMLERAVARDPDDHHLQDGLAQALLALGKGKEALAYAQKIIKKRPRRAAYRLLEGDAYMLLGNRVAAVSSWRVALELEPLNGEAKRRLGH